MNHWHNDFMAEYHRQDLFEQAEQIRLETSAATSRVYRPGWFERRMFNVANWMISTGKQLRKRYEMPSVDCNKTAAGSVAH